MLLGLAPSCAASVAVESWRRSRGPGEPGWTKCCHSAMDGLKRLWARHIRRVRESCIRPGEITTARNAARWWLCSLYTNLLHASSRALCQASSPLLAVESTAEDARHSRGHAALPVALVCTRPLDTFIASPASAMSHDIRRTFVKAARLPPIPHRHCRGPKASPSVHLQHLRRPTPSSDMKAA